MKLRWQKTFLAALLATTSVYGDANCNTSSNAGHELQDNQITGAYNAPASYDVKNACNVFLSADFLYWQAREDNLEYGVTTSDVGNAAIINGSVLNMNFDWHPGVKVGLGANFTKHDNWDMFAEWTYLNAHNSSNATVLAPGGIYMSLPPATTVIGQTYNHAEARWKLIYNTFDLNLGRAFYSGKMLSFRPHAGLRGAWFKQSEIAKYILDSTGATTLFQSKFNSWGIGPRFGLESNWMLGAGFKIFGNAAFSLVFDFFTVNESSQQDLNSFTTSVKDKNRNNQVRPNAEAALGFAWGSYFSNNSWHVDLSLGYEFQYWPDANGQLRFVDDNSLGIFVSGGDLALQGVTFKARFDF